MSSKLAKALAGAKGKGDIAKALLKGKKDVSEDSPLDMAIDDLCGALKSGDDTKIKSVLKSVLEIAKAAE